MKLNILYEDQDLLVINKPSNLVVNRATTIKAETIQDWFVKKFGENYFTAEFWQKDSAYQKLIPDDFTDEFGDAMTIWQERLGVVHRLDKDTSGVLLLAKNPGALLNLLAQFKQRQTAKTYLALVHGHFVDKNGIINAPLARHAQNRLKYAIDNNGRPALTNYEVKQEFSFLHEETIELIAQQSKTKTKKVKELYQTGFSLVEVAPQTGRTHQIRVHMSAMQHPIVGDQLYTGRKRSKLDNFWCKRQFLHASTLRLKHPRTQKELLFEAPLSQDLKQVLTLVL
jgi:23S rRNA pseudouridine1911/1915/1917 synthase